MDIVFDELCRLRASVMVVIGWC